LGLSFLLVCEGLFNLLDREQVANVMTTLLQSDKCTELFLLVAIHFHTKKTTAIVELVRNALNLHVIFHTDSLNSIGHLITSQIFTEEIAAKRAIELTPISNVCNSNSKSKITIFVYIFIIFYF